MIKRIENVICFWAILMSLLISGCASAQRKSEVEFLNEIHKKVGDAEMALCSEKDPILYSVELLLENEIERLTKPSWIMRFFGSD